MGSPILQYRYVSLVESGSKVWQETGKVIVGIETVGSLDARYP
jgi:hypothetical protein